MASSNMATFGGIVAVLGIALCIGMVRTGPSKPKTVDDPVPSVGKIQVLNGSGNAGVADKMADFLRTNKFDVKQIGNAASFNYPFTMVISRTRDMTIAEQVAEALNTRHLVMVRTEDQTYDVTVVIGPDYGGNAQ